MKKPYLILFVLISCFTEASLWAKTICTMTFNSKDEREALRSELVAQGDKIVELVPESNSPNWFDESCRQGIRCDVLLISGHFGGLFFGEKSTQVLTLNQLNTHKLQGSCKGILDAPKSVFLMGCNTLSGKTPDHRSVDDYLRVLVGDGFPLNVAEAVSESRYLPYSQSMQDMMRVIFSDAKFVYGFESTGPLGRVAGPRLKKAVRESSKQDRILYGVSKNSLLKNFAGTNVRVLDANKPIVETVANSKATLKLLHQAKFAIKKEESKIAWKKILQQEYLPYFYHFILDNQKHENLNELLTENEFLKDELKNSLLEIHSALYELPSLQFKILTYLHNQRMINISDFRLGVSEILSFLSARDLDYVITDQICRILKESSVREFKNQISYSMKMVFNHPIYGDSLKNCFGDELRDAFKNSSVRSCLMNKLDHDWGCLTNHSQSLDLNSCLIAHGRNPDKENADDMLFYCYDQLSSQQKINKGECLRLTHEFDILGNQIKMNWNCVNRIR